MKGIWIVDRALNDQDRTMLHRCVELAQEALDGGNAPFGSLIVGANGSVLLEARNAIASGDNTQHPEFQIARWAALNLTPAERAGATVYTSGEHCPMCSAAHAMVGLGPIVYASSSKQLVAWRDEFGAPKLPFQALPIEEVALNIPAKGPVADLSEQVRSLHEAYHRRAKK